MKLTFIADTHHYSKTLGITGKAYKMRSESDQKCLGETDEIIDSAFDQISASDTEAVFVLGDVTNNGEVVSHEEFRQKLYHLQQTKPIYIITATHDWCSNESPRRYDGDNIYTDVPVMKSEKLPKFYKDFGPSQAIDSFVTRIGTICYTLALSDKVRVLCLNDDKNDENHAGFSEECFQWIEKQIKDANDNGCTIIGIMHHLIMSHSSRLICVGSVCVANREIVASRLADAGLKYMLVGHSHIQATDKFTSPSGNTITEINVGSLCGYPAPIVNVETNDDGTISYEVDHLKQIKFGDKSIDAMPYLAKHSCLIINKVLECRTSTDFCETLKALNISTKLAKELFIIAKPIIKKIDTMLVGDAYKILKALGFANGISKKDMAPIYYKSLKEMINEVFLSLFDGQLHTHDRDDVYYKLVIAFFSIPAKLKKDNEHCEELIRFADYLMTGGEINNQKATI